MALTDNLVAYYKFDESSGNASDSVGGNTLVNTDTTYASALINNGAVFDGSTAQLTCNPTSFDFFGTANFSYSLWIYADSLPASVSYIVDIWNGSGADDKRIALNSSGKITFGLFDGAAKNATWSGTASTATWYHVVATYDGSTMRIYVNNSSPNTASASGSFNETPSILLVSRAFDVNPFDGIVDEFGIWSRALTADEVSELYNGGAGLQYPFTGTPAFVPKAFWFS